MRALLNWSGALAGLLLLITGGLLHPAWLQWSDTSGWQSINLGVTAQLPALLLTALICGPRPALMAAIAYLALGLSVVMAVWKLLLLVVRARLGERAPRPGRQRVRVARPQALR